MGNKLTAGERATMRALWAVWYLEKKGVRRLTTTAGERARIEAWAAWHLRELVAELEDVARAKGRTVDTPDPLTFAALLEALVDLEVDAAEFFDGVTRRWHRRPPPMV